MGDLLKAFQEKKPEIVLEWSDSETEAEGWVVINSLRGGAAGGGTRMRKGLDRKEVESLAKTMEVKFTISGPAIGGAKSGISFDPDDPRKPEVLKRWYRSVIPLLKSYYGTGGDLNVDEIAEVIPSTEALGLWHPQEGIVNGHYKATDPQKIQKLGQLRQGVKKVLEDSRFTITGQKLTVADMITGYGVAEAVFHYYRLWSGEIKGKRAIIQGWGNVGGAAACYLAKNGAKIVGIIDSSGGLIDKEGLGLEQTKELYLGRYFDRKRFSWPQSFDQVNNAIWGMGAEIFVPAAASRLVGIESVEQMIGAGLEIISCGANVPFNDPEIFNGATSLKADNGVSVIPDFIANCGMARVFAYLMESEAELTDEAIFMDTSNTIRAALQRVHDEDDAKTGISQRALQIALRELLSSS